MLTTSCGRCHNSCATETGLSDLCKKVVTVMKTHFQEKKRKIIQSRDSSFSAEKDRQCILSFLSSRDLARSGFDTFMTKCKNAFDIRISIKHKYIRSKKSPFMNK